MKHVEEELRLHYRPLDPAAGHPLPSAEEQDADLRRILAGPMPVRAGEAARSRRGLPRRRLLAVGLVAATVVTGVAVGIGSLTPTIRPAGGHPLDPLVVEQAPPDQPAAADLLRTLSQRVEVLPDDRGSGQIERVRSEFWWLYRPSDRSAPSTLERSAPTEVLFRPDSTRQITEFPAAGPPKVTTDFGAFRAPLPLQEEGPFRRWLRDQAGSFPNGEYDSIMSLVRNRALGPRPRAWLLRELATVPGVSCPGRTTDHTGRRGLACVVSGLDAPDPYGEPVRRTLVIDERDGRVLAHEMVMTTHDEHFEVPVPAVRSYEQYLVSDRVPAR